MATDKKQVRRSIHQLQTVKTWQLLVLLTMSILVSATFLRLNNIGMVERRDAVVSADKTGNLEDIQNRLYDLQRYVNTHMNTSTGRIALEHQYARDAEKAKSAVDVGSGTSAQQAAIAACDPIATANGWRWPDPRYTACVSKELDRYNQENAGGEVQVNLPNQGLYYHEFIAPVWSSDFAGWSTLVSLVIAIMILVRMISVGILKLLLKRSYSSV